jgi:hypothetical protein
MENNKSWGLFYFEHFLLYPEAKKIKQWRKKWELMEIKKYLVSCGEDKKNLKKH